MGAIAQFIVTILIALAAMIAMLWAVPFTWGAAGVNTAIFVAISVPMALILTFMSKTLKIQSNLKIPKIKCFDKNTLLKMNDGSVKSIYEIEIGDLLFNNNEVTGKIKVITEGSQMYNLNDVIVSDSHIVKYNDEWIPVSNHPESKILFSYKEPFLYCLNTTSKIIEINDIFFTDWDEIYDQEDINKFNLLLSLKFDNTYKFKTEDIHKYLDGGFVGSSIVQLKNKNKVEIKNIQIGDILEDGEKVFGLVEINGKNISEQCIYYLGNNKRFEGGCNLILCDKTINLFTTLDLDISNKLIQPNKENKLYHLLTDKQTLNVNKMKFFHYNTSIDFFLEKNSEKLLSIKYI
jgi:hypothetical protein